MAGVSYCLLASSVESVSIDGFDGGEGSANDFLCIEHYPLMPFVVLCVGFTIPHSDGSSQDALYPDSVEVD